MIILPIGTRVWIARAALPAIGAPNMAGDGTVTGHTPCMPCWTAFIGAGRLVSRDEYHALGASCENPIAFVVTLGTTPITVAPGDPAVLAVPITDSERSAA